jgi:hypothetical protein
MINLKIKIILSIDYRHNKDFIILIYYNLISDLYAKKMTFNIIRYINKYNVYLKYCNKGLYIRNKIGYT